MAIRNANTALSDAKKFSAIDTLELARLMEKGDLEALREETERIERKTDIFTKADERHRARTPEQIQKIKDAAQERQDVMSSTLFKPIQRLQKEKIYQNEAERMDAPLSSEETIKKIAGKDNTYRGACSSLAIAYAGNRAGYDVRDFRDGKSCDFFGSSFMLDDIANAVGGVVEQKRNDFSTASSLLKNVAEGKEYIFGVSLHTAIVRKTGDTIEYLELQRENVGFHPLTKEILKDRFKCQTSHSSGKYHFALSGELIDIEMLGKDKAFRRLLGYLNTDEDKQVKGVW